MDRHAGMLKVSKKFLIKMLMDKFSLPDDTYLHYISNDPQADTLDFILYSDEFSKVPEGMIPPLIVPKTEWDVEENHGS